MKLTYDDQTPPRAQEALDRLRPEDLRTLWSALGMARLWAESNLQLASAASDVYEEMHRRFTELGERLAVPLEGKQT